MGLGWALLSSGTLLAQYPDFSTAEVRQMSIAQGLPARTVYGAAYDAHGLLWLSTGGGLCRYGGYAVSTFPRLARQFHGRMRRDDGGRLLCVLSHEEEQYGDSLEIFDPATLAASGLLLNRSVPAPYAGYYHRAGRPLYLAGGQHVYRLAGPGERPRPVHRLARPLRAGDRLVWADSAAYLILSAGGEPTLGGSADRKPLPERGPVLAAYRDAAGGCWASYARAVYHWPPGAAGWRRLTTEGPNASPALNTFYEDRAGHLLIGHHTGYELNALYYPTPQGLHPVTGLLEVEDRILDLGGADFRQEVLAPSFNGLLRFRFAAERPQIFRTHLSRRLQPGQFGRVMRGITRGDDGYVYAHKDGNHPLWYRLDPASQRIDSIVIRDNLRRVARQDGCGMDLINFRGRIYGTNCQRGSNAHQGQIYCYDPTTEDWRQWELPRPNQIGRSILPTGRPGELLIIAEQSLTHVGGQIFRFRPARDSIAAVALRGLTAGLTGRVKRTVYDSARGRYWIGTTTGLFSFDPAGNHLREHPAAAADQPLSVSDIYLEADSSLLIGTFGRGILRYQPASGTFRTEAAQLDDDNQYLDIPILDLPSNDIAFIYRPHPRELLVTTFNGLYHRDSTGLSHVFTTADGLSDNEFNSISFFYDSADSVFYAGGINGLVSFRRSDLAVAPSAHHPVMLRYHRFGDQASREITEQLPPRPTAPLNIAPDVSYFTLDYALTDYRNPAGNRFQTRLVPLDADWSPPTTTNSTRFTRLPPGDYTFQVRGTDAWGRTTADVLSYPIHVATPWHQQWWVRLLGLLLFAGLVLFVERLAQRGRRRRREQRAAYERRLLDLELRTLRQQMNPHFVFNALNSVRDFVRRGEREQSADYLLDFSRLMRLFLESSRNRFLPLRQELDLLDKYVTLEQLRFPGKFTYGCTVAPDLDPDFEEVPCLLLQPLVENAIVHGLFHLTDRRGHLSLDVRSDPDREETLICTITDDGVGRAYAAGRRAPSAHRSRATQIFAERQELLATQGEVRIALFTEDLHPGREHTGTRVTVYFNYGDDPLPAVAPPRRAAPAAPVPGA